MTDLQKLLSALDAWIKSEGLTPPPYLQREIDRHESPCEEPKMNKTEEA